MYRTASKNTANFSVIFLKDPTKLHCAHNMRQSVVYGAYVSLLSFYQICGIITLPLARYTFFDRSVKG